jgi:D-glycero-D-manno-heptose 1,7-bisphosphate phosphatase
MRPGLFLDRDGTLIEHVDYLRDPGQIRFLPGVIDGLRRAQSAGFALVLISNQSGIGLGKMTHDDLDVVQCEFDRQLEIRGVVFDRAWFATEPRGTPGSLRKPSPHFVFVSAEDLEIDLSLSSFVGDRADDVFCAVNAGVQPVLVKTGFGAEVAKVDEIQRSAVIVPEFESAIAAAFARARISLEFPGGRGSV